jgi:hypothetical protein
MDNGVKITRSKTVARKATPSDQVAQERTSSGKNDAITHAITTHTETQDSDPGEDESLDLIIKNPELPITVIDDVINKSSVPPIQEATDDRAMIWERLKAAQKSGDTFLAKILLETYNAKEIKSSTLPALNRSESASAVLSTADIGKSKDPPAPIIDSRLAETELEDNLVYAVGAVTNHQDIGFTPYFDENIRKLRAPLPLTIFDRGKHLSLLIAFKLYHYTYHNLHYNYTFHYHSILLGMAEKSLERAPSTETG